MEIPGIDRLAEGVNAEEITVFTVLLLLSASLTFLYTSQDQTVQKVTFSGELNSSENMMVLDFFNESAELMLEQSDKSRFYIDLDRDGSADIELTGLNHDGNARKSSKILDYRSGAYQLEYRYSDDANRTEDAWLQPLEIRRLE